jgi:selenide,water dikinase
VGGHTIRGETPIVGLSVSSIAPLRSIKRKAGSRVGDLVLLTKPIGSGIAIAADQQELLSDDEISATLSLLKRSNRVGARMGHLESVSAMTDVTGFGLIGHTYEVAESSGVTIRLRAGDVPLLPGVANAAREGVVPLLAEENLAAYGAGVRFETPVPRHVRLILCDPQTIGGLLISVDPRNTDEILAIMVEYGVAAAVVGEVVPTEVGGAMVEVIN